MTVLITGASRGIGAALTARFLKEGHHTVIAVSRNKKRLDELKNRLIMEAPSVKLLVKVLDLTVESELKSFIAWFEESFSSLDILVNNAGIAGPVARLEDIAVADWGRTIDVNLNGTFYVTRKAVPMMKNANSGSIINIASTAAL
ncbi:MAG TPA: SDR family NAD(P)-dependent oxidoreductase, partial [Bacteroidales bacterium]|nr:SDR family NAD(P)-dependent oxidoreductase [Bacteroidales bacterium]